MFGSRQDNLYATQIGILANQHTLFLQLGKYNIVSKFFSTRIVIFNGQMRYVQRNISSSAKINYVNIKYCYFYTR